MSITVGHMPKRSSAIGEILCRENTEGEYSGLEHEVVPDVVESLKVITQVSRCSCCSARCHALQMSGYNAACLPYSCQPFKEQFRVRIVLASSRVQPVYGRRPYSLLLRQHGSKSMSNLTTVAATADEVPKDCGVRLWLCLSQQQEESHCSAQGEHHEAQRWALSEGTRPAQLW